MNLDKLWCHNSDSARFGEYLVFKKGGAAVCETKKYCKRFDNWHWWEAHQRCYRQFSQGPCKKGTIKHCRLLVNDIDK